MKEKIIKYLPTKDFAKKLGLAILLIVIIWVLNFVFSKVAKKSVTNIFVTGDGSEVELKDTDGDGLYDWEEVLWNLDITSKDSDGDGIGDMDEVRKTQAVYDDSTYYTEDDLTQTELLARQFYTTAATIASSGSTIDPKAIEELGDALQESLSAERLPNRFSVKDLTIVPLSEKNFFAYRNVVLGALQEAANNGVGTELELLSSLSEENGGAVAGSVGQIAVEYEGLVSIFARTPVPDFLRITHLDFLNSLAKVQVSLLNISRLESDPVVGASGLSQYANESGELEQRLTEFYVHLETIEEYFSQN